MKEKLDILIQHSNEWRGEILKQLSNVDIGIIISGTRQLGLAPRKDICTISFTNLLQRYALEISTASTEVFHSLVMDWDNDLRDEYCQVYCNAYYSGKGIKEEDFLSGPIKDRQAVVGRVHKEWRCGALFHREDEFCSAEGHNRVVL